MTALEFLDRVVAYREKFGDFKGRDGRQRAGTFGKLMEEFGEFIGSVLKEHEPYKRDEEWGDTLFSLLYLLVDEMGELETRSLLTRVIHTPYFGIPHSMKRANAIAKVTEVFAVLLMHIDEGYRGRMLETSADFALRYLYVFALGETVLTDRAYKIVAAKNDKKITGETPTRLGKSGNMIRV